MGEGRLMISDVEKFVALKSRMTGLAKGPVRRLIIDNGSVKNAYVARSLTVCSHLSPSKCRADVRGTNEVPYASSDFAARAHQ
jgi:hypothetical protein